jgi:hypothetical protein
MSGRQDSDCLAFRRKERDVKQHYSEKQNNSDSEENIHGNHQGLLKWGLQWYLEQICVVQEQMVLYSEIYTINNTWKFITT